MLFPEGMGMIWPKDRITRFETARIIGARSLQISLGAPILVDYKGEFDSLKIAQEEFKAGMIPITIKRTLPNNQTIVVDIKTAIKNWIEDHPYDSWS
jgi:DNA-directed RNA polymerase subunit K